MNTPLLEGKSKKYSIAKILGICASTLGFEQAFNALFSLSEPIMEKLDMKTTSKFVCWLAGPFAGLLILPMIGVFSDRCTSKLGRRRPFIIGGCIVTMIGFALLYILKIYGTKLSSTAVTICMFLVLFLNYGSINTMMGPSRALIGDVIPEEQQDVANSIASVLIGISSVLPNLVGGVGYFVKSSSYAEMADSLTLIFCFITIFVCVTITCCTAKESIQAPSKTKPGNPFKDVFLSLKSVPKPVAQSFVLIIMSWVANYMFTMMGTEFFMNEVFPAEDSAKGLCFGMLVIASSNAFSFIYGCFHASLSDCIGYKATYCISHIIEALSLASVFFVHNPWYLFACLTPIGMAIANFNSTPYSIVGLTCDDNTMGVYMSVLSTCIDISYLTANCLMNLAGSSIFCALHKSSWKITKLQTLIGASSVFALLTAVYSLFVKYPPKNANGEYDQLNGDNQEEQNEEEENKEIISKVPDEEDEVRNCPEL